MSKLILSFLKRGILQKKKLCSPWEQILSFWSRPFSEGACRAVKQTGNHKNRLPFQKSQKIYQVYPVHLIFEASTNNKGSD